MSERYCTCPTCGSTLRVRGRVTQSFVSVDVRAGCYCESGRHAANIGAYASRATGEIERLETTIAGLRQEIEHSEMLREGAEQERDRYRAALERVLVFGDDELPSVDVLESIETYVHDVLAGTREGEAQP